jgi:hypothetical protein
MGTMSANRKPHVGARPCIFRMARRAEAIPVAGCVPPAGLSSNPAGRSRRDDVGERRCRGAGAFQLRQDASHAPLNAILVDAKDAADLLIAQSRDEHLKHLLLASFELHRTPLSSGVFRYRRNGLPSAMAHSHHTHASGTIM